MSDGRRAMGRHDVDDVRRWGRQAGRGDEEVMMMAMMV